MSTGRTDRPGRADPSTPLDAAEIARRRMRNVGLVAPAFPAYTEVVRWLGAVQAQDYEPAKWSLAQRLRSVSESALEEELSAGRLIRTHLLRPTWHFVLPEDLRWMLELTAPRVHGFNRYYYRQFGIDEALPQRCSKLLETELQGGNSLTRKEIEVLLCRSGIEASGTRLGLLLMHAELEGLICSGPRRGKQQTYALLEERVPPAPTMDRESALVELARRYYTSHGPATIKDFRWWSSLPSAEIVDALEAVGDGLIKDSVGGTTFWSANPGRDDGRKNAGPAVHLLQSYDEYLVGYTESKYVLDISGVARSRSPGRTIFNQVVLLDSQVAGYWRRTTRKGIVRIEVVLDSPFTAAQSAALRTAADQYAEFLGLAAELTVSPEAS